MTKRNTQPYSALVTPGHARLTFVAGPCPPGITYSLSGKAHVAGRADNADISLAEDPHAGDQHASFAYKDGKLVVSDNGSTNGVYVRVRGPQHLEHGDWIRLGDQYFIFELIKNQDEYPSEDGTLHFISPKRKGCSFRVVQVLEGGRLGLASTSSSDELSFGGEGSTVAFTADAHLSKQHAKIAASGGGKFAIEDLGSTNGTYVRVRGEAALSHGDYVFIGKQLIRIDLS